MPTYAEFPSSLEFDLSHENALHAGGFNNGDAGKRLKKIEATIQQSTLNIVRDALKALCVGEITVIDVHSCGGLDVRRQVYRGTQYEVFVPKVKVEVVVSTVSLSRVLRIFSVMGQTAGTRSNQRILVYDVTDATEESS